MTAEEWRPTVAFPHYLVSNLGRIASTHRSGEPRVLSPWVNSQGYLFVAIREPGVKRAVAVHRIVADAWIGPRVDGLETRHLDGDKNNNAASNLALGTHSENMHDLVRHGAHVGANKTACVNGHRYDEANTFYSTEGARLCRICSRARQAAYMTRKAFAAAGFRTQAGAA